MQYSITYVCVYVQRQDSIKLKEPMYTDNVNYIETEHTKINNDTSIYTGLNQDATACNNLYSTEMFIPYL